MSDLAALSELVLELPEELTVYIRRMYTVMADSKRNLLGEKHVYRGFRVSFGLPMFDPDKQPYQHDPFEMNVGYGEGDTLEDALRMALDDWKANHEQDWRSRGAHELATIEALRIEDKAHDRH